MLDHLFAKLERRDRLTGEERDVLVAMVGEVRSFDARRVIVRQGEPLAHSTLLLEGYVARHKDLPGGQRQIVEIHIPGDFIDLPSFLLKMLEHDLGTLTRVRVALVPHERLVHITEAHPHLARLLWLTTLIEGAAYREQILTIGRRPALARLAHLFCETFVRHRISGLSEGDSFPLPLTQADLGDATGMTAVHVNRMMRQLREAGLIEFVRRRLRILDWERLRAVAEFDPAYLYIDRRPR